MQSRLALLLMLLVASFRTLAQGGTVTGNVTNEANQPLRCAVTLTDSGKVKYATLTDSNGHYRITAVKPGRYDVTATTVGYQSYSMKEVTIADGKTRHVNMVLQRTITNQPDRIVKTPEKLLKAETTVAAAPPPAMYDKSKKEQYALGAASVHYDAANKDLSSVYQWRENESKSKPQFYDPSEESYKKNAENDFMNVKSSPMSTMSVDVDRASYSNVRRFINDGRRPPADAVRIEEMVNYFDYDYPQPKGEDPIAIETELTDCAWQKDHKILNIGMQAKKVATDKLPPSNLVFLIDVSGSMDSPERLPLLVAGMKMLVQNLRAIDKVSIVAYAGNAGLVLAPTSGNNKEKILGALDRLEAGGSTAGGAGIKLAYKIATQNFIKGGNNRVLLATDGDFNVGVSSDNELEDLITKERETGVYLTCLGFGTDNYKDAKMEMLADKGNGNYDYIDNIQEAQKTLVSEFGGTLFTIAKDVKAQIEFNPAKVQGYRLIGYEDRMLNTEDFKDDKKDAGDMGSGHTVTIMYEIIPVGAKSDYLRPINDLKYQLSTAPASNFSNELATIKFRYKKPDGDKSKEMVHTIANKTTELNNASENTRFSTAVAMFGMLLKDSKYKGSSSYSQVINLAENSREYDKEGYRAEFIRLVKASKEYNLVAASE